MPALLKAVHEFAEAATQDTPGSGTAEAFAQLAEEATDAALPGGSGSTLSDAGKGFVEININDKKSKINQTGTGCRRPVRKPWQCVYADAINR